MTEKSKTTQDYINTLCELGEVSLEKYAPKAMPSDAMWMGKRVLHPDEERVAKMYTDYNPAVRMYLANFLKTKPRERSCIPTFFRHVRFYSPLATDGPVTLGMHDLAVVIGEMFNIYIDESGCIFEHRFEEPEVNVEGLVMNVIFKIHMDVPAMALSCKMRYETHSVYRNFFDTVRELKFSYEEGELEGTNFFKHLLAVAMAIEEAMVQFDVAAPTIFATRKKLEEQISAWLEGRDPPGVCARVSRKNIVVIPLLNASARLHHFFYQLERYHAAMRTMIMIYKAQYIRRNTALAEIRTPENRQ